MPIETKTQNLNWPGLQGTMLGGGAYTLERFASADENTATFETHTGGERGSKALVRLAQADDEASEQQLQVWQAIKRSGHPNLIPIWGMGRTKINGHSLIYVVMEASDENLGNVLEERALDPAEVGEILSSLVGALGHLHSHGFVHGGLSPEQVMAVGESVKVATGGVRRIGSLEGLDFYKPKYRAPESFEGNISPAADLWCLGATLLQALTQRVCSGDCLEHAASLPAPFDAIATSCLQTEPGARGTLAHLLALYDGTATSNGPVASAAEAGNSRTMAAAAGSGRGAISFDWDEAEGPETTKRDVVPPVYLAPGPRVPEADAFAAEAAAGSASENAPVDEGVKRAAVVADGKEASVEEAMTGAPSDAEERLEELAPGDDGKAGASELTAPSVPEERVEEETAARIAAQEPVEIPVEIAGHEVIPHSAETPAEETSFQEMQPLLPRMPVQAREDRYSPHEGDERNPVAAANARLLAWREAAAAASRARSSEPDEVKPVSVAPDAIKQAKRRAWVFVAVALLILVAVVWVLRPSRSANKKAEQRVAQNAGSTAGSIPGSGAQSKHEQPIHGRTMTLPAAGQNEQASSGAVAAAPNNASAPSSTAATASAKAEDAAQNAAPVGRGPVWRVILYTYNREADAKRRAATINRRHPDLGAEVFTPNGAGKSPFLVSVGGSTDRDAMTQLRHTAVGHGLPRDSYLQNYSR